MIRKKIVQNKKISMKPVFQTKSDKGKNINICEKKIIYVAILLFLFLNVGFKTHEMNEEPESDIRIYELLSRHKEKVFGFDVSQYQGSIKWNSIAYIEGIFPLHFVFIRATSGKDEKDKFFCTNWRKAKKTKLFRGAYHYYMPDENSIEQADNFIKAVKLKKGDFPPVLDIEELPKNQSLDSLKVGLQTWLDRVETHYGKKPIIYSGDDYYKTYLKKEFSGYTNWIANYDFPAEGIGEDWLFWQFTDKATIGGIEGKVDANIFNGSYEQLNYITIGN